MPSIPNTVRKIHAALRATKSYQLGLLQTKAYRVLKQRTDEALASRHITSTDWAFLGLLNDTSTGMRAVDIAEELGVEAPFVTALVKKIEPLGYLDMHSDPTDSRAKLICLSKKGSVFVSETETHVREKMRPLLNGSSVSDLAGYALVLQTIVKNISREPS